MKNLSKSSKKKAVKKEVRKRYVKNKTDLTTAFSPEKIQMVQELIQPLIRSVIQSRSEMQFQTNTSHDLFLYDFEKTYLPDSLPMGVPMMAVTDAPIANISAKAVVKPKDVLHELETVPTNINIENLDFKIAVLEKKKSLIRENAYSKAETIGMITRLTNRKKYEDHKQFFEQFQNTTGQAIDALIGKYELEMRSSDLFVPEFPDEAIIVMTAYEQEVIKLCGKKPVFYVISEAGDFQKKYEKRDPILLAQSPFGIYYQILGAWDKEMILLSEL